ncbi:hypothetical protein KSK55_03065 [Methanospirillum purgamenti]|jgi:hypothetical protein|uniref:Uncharacterized protein n=1 Tax=Methanospirillum hungatei TaxID=2203 RepID=A0A8F5ZH51_METHU|nr:hypothetical protein [Methanospirillum hungatei]QXO95399.1 hypothetical protein KSK55_03065 [Methanospirillum hungatei]
MTKSKLLFARLTFHANPSDLDLSIKKTLELRKKSLLGVISYSMNPNKIILQEIEEMKKKEKEINKKEKQTKKIILDDWSYIELIRDSRYYNKSLFKFAGIQINDNTIFGKLGKNTSHQYNVEDDETEDFRSEFIESKDFCYFLIDIKSSIICFENKNTVGHLAPIILIQDAFNALHRGVEQIEINLITKRKSILDNTESMKKITKISLKLSLPNPNSTPLSEPMRQYIKRMNADGMEMDVNSPKGLDMGFFKAFFVSGIALAEEGYGKVKVKGIVEKNNKDQGIVIETYNYPYSVSTDLSTFEKTTDKEKVLLENIHNLEELLEENKDE